MTLPEFPVGGGCQCGAVRYRLKAAPRAIYSCHCKDCQRFSGATHTISMVVRRADFEIAAGAPAGYDRLADSGRVVRMMACPICGVKSWNEPLASPDLIILKAGSLDDMGWAAPVGNIWTDSAPPWTRFDPDVPNFPGQPPDRQTLIDAYAAAVARA